MTSSTDLEKEKARSYLSGGSMAYLDGLYEDYLADPHSIPEEWRQVFNTFFENKKDEEHPHREIREYFLHTAQAQRKQTVLAVENKQYQVTDLINAYRTFGHLEAELDPLGLVRHKKVPSLELAYHHLTTEDLAQSFYVGAYFDKGSMMLKDLVSALRQTYCGSIGIEYMYIANTEELEWLQKIMESTKGRPHFSAEKKKSILSDLVAADGLERYLGTRYVGQKRFSLEGGDAFIPLMKELILKGGANAVNEIVIGMAHRGRLNILVNVLGKEPDELFQEFEGKIKSDRTGDVKYHQGFSADLATEKGAISITLAFNPSHLEIISPVVEGSVRARLERRCDLEKKDSVIPVIVHGDAAFTGQGVVMETFNFSQARGYATGGTIHIVVNNQIGFTTSNPSDARSTHYCTDIAKMIEAPVIHVNGDDPEAVVFAAQIAFDYRMKFNRDVVIDLVCYRRHGHNEADEPLITQPLMYKKVKTMKPLREYYAEKLIHDGVLQSGQMEEMMEAYRNHLDKGQAVVKLTNGDIPGIMHSDWSPYLHGLWTDKADTAVSKADLVRLAKTLAEAPKGFQCHPVVQKLLDEREKMAGGDLLINWGFAEIMAYATLLEEGYIVRLSGQDSGRGTFAHRHAVLHDINTGDAFIPLKNIKPKAKESERARFSVIDSVLSEAAVLAFEYGYSSSEPEALVLWEAQFGDFANGAQVVIDQFISSGEQKWGRLCGLVMLLPHGYEGQGPEHSSARLERYMQLCAQHNIQVCTPTTPAQLFHLLRRQMLRPFRKPLIIMTPKSLLRHKLVVSSLEDLTHGSFHTVIPEIDDIKSDGVTKVVLCCGKVYYDLLQKRRALNINDVAIIRIEQLYPFPVGQLQALLDLYPKATKIVWCQEEPQNQGVWFSSQHHFHACLKSNQFLSYAGREFAAAPSVGSAVLHAKEQEDLVIQALMD